MATINFLDKTGLSYLWGKIKALIPTKTSDLTNDSGFLTSYTETDPTVPNWAKASTKPSYTASEVGALPDTTTIPTTTSDLTNDSGFITSADVPDASSTTPLMNGTASVGSEDDFARGDHVHPTDTSRAAASHTHGADDITSGTLPIARGGTGATSVSDVVTALKAVTYTATGMNPYVSNTSGAEQIWALYATCKNSNNTDRTNDLVGLIIYNDHVKIWNNTENNTLFDLKAYSAATQSAAGLMSAADKKKLDGVATGATAGISGFTTNYTDISIGTIAANNYVSSKSATITKPSGYTHCTINGWYIIGTTRNTWVNIYQLYTDQSKVYCSAANLSSTATSSDTKLRVYFTWVK